MCSKIFLASSIPQSLIRSIIKPTYRTRYISSIRNLSTSNPNSRATFINSQNQHETGKVPEDDIELHEEEAEEIHGSYLQHISNEPNDESEIPLEGVPKIDGKLLDNEALTRKEMTKSANELKALKKKNRIDKKMQSQINSDEMKQAAIEIEKKKEISFRNSLKSYLTMCMQQNMVYKAMMLLRNYHSDEKYFKSSEVYDAVLKEAALSCSWKLIKEVVAMMDEGGVPFSLDSFAACFVSLGRRSEQETGLNSLSENLLDKMVSCGLDAGEIFLKCKFTSNHRELAVKGIRLAIPDFEPAFPSIPSSYVTPLLNSLNDLKVDSAVQSPVSGLLTEEEY